MSTDRIEKKIVLRATRERVWQALTDSSQFGSWFGMKLEGPFEAGAPIKGSITPTTVDAEVAKHQQPYEGHPVELYVEQIVPQRLFSFRWHPHAIERGADYSKEPTTLVSFELEDAPEGILLTMSESGFDSIPIERRAKAFTANEGGWAIQCTLIEKYLAKRS